MENLTACIEGTGTLRPDGYYVKDKMLEHRRAYVDCFGSIPEGHVVHHACENSRCVNALHLHAMTQSDHARLHHDSGLSDAEKQERGKKSRRKWWANISDEKRAQYENARRESLAKSPERQAKRKAKRAVKAKGEWAATKADPEKHEREKRRLRDRHRERYANDPEYREMHKRKARERYWAKKNGEDR